MRFLERIFFILDAISANNSSNVPSILNPSNNFLILDQLLVFQTSVLSISLKLSSVTIRNVKPALDKLNSYSWFGSSSGIFLIPKRANNVLGSSSKQITLANPNIKPCISAG